MRTRSGRLALAGSVVTVAIAYLPWFTFAVFLQPLLETAEWSREAVTGIFSAYVITGGLVSPIVGSLLARADPLKLQAFGAVALACGLAGAAASNDLWQLYLTYGVLAGIGSSFMGILPNYTAAVRVFPDAPGVALAVVGSGGNAGALLAVPIIQLLVLNHGWRGAMGILAAVSIAAIPLLVVRSRIRGIAGHPERWTPPAHEPAKFSNRLVSVVFGFFAAFAAFHLVFVHLIAMLFETGIDALSAATAVGVLGLIAIGSRLAAGVLLDRAPLRSVGRLVLWCAALGMTLVAAGLWHAAPGYLLWSGIVLLYAAYGGAAPLAPFLTSNLVPPAAFAATYGFTQLGVTMGAAVGPLLGASAREFSGSYFAATLLGLCLLAAAWVSLHSAMRGARETYMPDSHMTNA